MRDLVSHELGRELGGAADDARLHLRHLRRGVVVVPDVVSPDGAHPWRQRWRRFLFGFTLPFTVANACLHHPALGPPAQTILRRQALVTLALGFLWYIVGDFDDIKYDNGVTISLTSGATGVAALIAALALVEWVVIALSREHHDRIGADVARLLGVLPDEDVVDPRVRLNLRWMWTKLKRRLQGVLVMIVSVAPAVIVLALMLLPLLPVLGDGVGVIVNVAVGAVLFYWVAVIALGKTSWCWRVDIDREPLPLRVITGIGARSRWLLPFRLWAGALRRSMAMIVRPARQLEHLPWEGAGLAAARLVMGLPVVYVVARPFFPVAATILLQARAPHVFAEPEPEQAEPTEQPEPTERQAQPLEPAPEPIVTSE